MAIFQRLSRWARSPSQERRGAIVNFFRRRGQIYQRTRAEYRRNEQPLVRFAMPIAPSGAAAAGARGAVGALRSARTAISTLFQRATGNPFAGAATLGAGLKSFAGRAAGRAAGIGLAYEAFQYQRAQQTGKPFKWLPNIGSLISFGVNPIASAAGTIYGAGENIASDVRDRIKDYPTPSTFTPQFTTGPTYFNFPEQSFPDYSPVGIPVGSTGPVGAFSPSFNVSSPSGPDLTQLLIALFGGAAAGYVAGRRKKKKKKYKKRKRR